MTTDTDINLDLTTDEQFRLVYNGIAAVAANCDGAVEDDGVGFNGQDTKFGKRIASVSFDEWTPEIRAEAARIARTYRKQIQASTGVDITALPVVAEAADHTNTVARGQARDFERRQEALAGRSVDAGTDPSSSFVIRWAKRDPEFRTFLDAVRRLPGRQWSGQEWMAPCTREAAVALTTGDLAGLPTTAAADAQIERLLAEPEAVVEEPAAETGEPITVEEWNAKVKAARNKVVLDGDRVRISFDYDAAMVSGVRRLPGRAYDGSSKTNTADIHPEVLAFADEFNLVVDPAVVEAIANLGEAQAEAQTEAQIRRAVSGLANPADLPEEFVNRVLAATQKAQVV